MPGNETAKSIDSIRHSLAHLLAAAVLEKFPKAKLGIGPVIENGFYYDFKLPRSLTPEDLKELEHEMRRLAAQKLPFKGEKITPTKARKLFKDQPFKLELIKDFIHPPKGVKKQPLSIYKTGDVFFDLCRGGHVKNTSEINVNAFRLEKIAGAYWRGNEKNPQLQRVYGLAFTTPKELDEYLKMQEEAKKRDHRKLGQELKLFSFSDYVGPGLPLWLPNGTIIINELEKLAKDTERKAGYLEVRTPHIAKEIMYKTSGHLPYYADTMFPPMKIIEENGKKETYYLKAMNCPHHHQIYAAEKRSYRDLPLRLSEYGTNYRYEKSGELFGLMRVRMLSMNDAHIYCAPEQFASEFNAVNEMYLNYFKIFGLNKYIMRFSTHDPKELGKKYVNEPKLWKKTEDMVRNVLKNSKINYIEVKNEAAFYGPKIDVQVWSAIGREFTLATNQVDFAVPGRFGLTYTDKDGKEQTPIVIHRAPLGTHERTIGFLIEHYAGDFPLWLAPTQIIILPISEKFIAYATKVKEELSAAGLRVKMGDSNETLGKRIREAEMQKIPYIAVVGEREAAEGTVAVRTRHNKDGGAIKLGEFVEKVSRIAKERIS
jgi:threonyl-tRNA synthetase